MNKVKLSCFIVISIFVIACSHNANRTDTRKPAESGGGDVGSVGTYNAICDNSFQDSSYLENLKRNSTKAAESSLENNSKLLVNQDNIKGINNLDIYQDFIRFEFNSNSAMRGQVQDKLTELAENGRNATQGESYLNSDGRWCFRLLAGPNDIKISRFSGNPKENQVLKAEITFDNGYHGGATEITMEFLFEVKNFIDIGNGDPKYIPRFRSALIKYPKLKNIRYQELR